ncbi:ABC transporter ATP-binding protein, partial [Yersinia frederiksenii]|uniref:ABC transporter ATP-binding protein n=1 Tax=Yersinia alsatica TaxID=2890317 RepID=UPI00119DCBC4
MERIKVTGLGKAYKQYNSQWGRLAEWFIPFSKNRHKTNWILQDINFSVRAGESVGVIGVNGAGKSTLLKMVTGTTQPTTGSIEVNGRVAALLELGMGFHPEFTGRQNVFMAGQLLGMNVNDISRLMSRIEEFAEIGDYIDQPVRVYSSGMQVRLAFSVATAIRPDLLIVDEAMSVGDIYFQQKCIARIEEFKNAGTSILFVTHDFSTLHTVCDRAILLANGRCQYIGKTIEAVERYFGYLNVNKAIMQEEKEIINRFIKVDN